MRVRVVSNRISKEVKKQRNATSFKRQSAVFFNLNGRIQLKDLDGKSYMAKGFYKRVDLESSKKRIFDLIKIKDENKRKRKEARRTNISPHVIVGQFGPAGSPQDDATSEDSGIPQDSQIGLLNLSRTESVQDMPDSPNSQRNKDISILGDDPI